MKTKKHFRISIITLIVASNLFFGIAFAAQPAPQTDKSVHATIRKQNESYEVVRFDIALEQGVYQDHYWPFKGKISNGAIVSFGKEDLAYFSVPNNLEISLCEDSTDIATGKMTGGCRNLSEGEFTIDMPYFPNGKYADIYDPSGKKVLTIDLTSKATCNENDRCDRPIEDSENCPQDCKKNEPKIDPAVVQLAAVNRQEEMQPEDGKTSLADLGWWGIAILIILLAGGGIGYYVYRRNREFEQ